MVVNVSAEFCQMITLIIFQRNQEMAVPGNEFSIRSWQPQRLVLDHGANFLKTSKFWVRGLVMSPFGLRHS